MRGLAWLLLYGLAVTQIDLIELGSSARILRALGQGPRSFLGLVADGGGSTEEAVRVAWDLVRLLRERRVFKVGDLYHLVVNDEQETARPRVCAP